MSAKQSMKLNLWILAVTIILPVGVFAAIYERAFLPEAQELLLSDGVYTDNQSSRGRRVYRRACESCHAAGLEGSEQGPSLYGEAFINGWDGEVLAEIMSLISNTMPAENPGGLSSENYVDVLAYILQVNGFPAGNELTQEAMDRILVGF